MKRDPLLIKSLNKDFGQFKINLDFSDNITLVTGESGSGKSYLYYLFSVFPVLSDYNFSLFNFQNISAADSLSTFVRLDLNILKELKNRVIVIDNFDIIKDDNILRYIGRDLSNQYILIGKHEDWLFLDLRCIKLLSYTEDSDGFITVSFNPVVNT